MHTFTAANFDAEVKQSKGLVLVDFWAAWCGPCNAMTPTLNKLADRFTDVKFGKVNVSEEQQLSSDHNVSSIPTIYFYKDGKIIGKPLVGLQREENLADLIQQLK